MGQKQHTHTRIEKSGARKQASWLSLVWRLAREAYFDSSSGCVKIRAEPARQIETLELCHFLDAPA